MAMEDCFTAAASSDSEWYEGLQRSGSCLKLYDLLYENRELIHQLGPDGVTVLHKGVDHGCVKLVRFVLVDMFIEAGICKCKGEENGLCALTREGLLRRTTEYGSTAVNMAIVSGSPKMVLLLDWAIRVSDKERKKVNTVKETSSPRVPGEFGELLKISSCDDERSEEVEPVVNEVDEVPDMKDDEISKSIYSNLLETWASEKIYDRDMQLELYKIIAAKLNEIAAKLNERYRGEDGVVLNFLKERCAKNVDFEFVHVEHIFLHFLISFGNELFPVSPTPVKSNYHWQVMDMILGFRERFIQDIVAECKMWDQKNETTESMQMTLFSILDPRGRTIMHTLFHEVLIYGSFSVHVGLRDIVEILKGVASKSAKP